MRPRTYLIAEGSKKIQHLRAGIFPLLAKIVNKGFVKPFKKVATKYGGSSGLEDLKILRWRIARFPFEMIRYIDQKVETLLGRPEKGMDHHSCCVGPAGL